jgi:hypothetical protein
MRLIKLAFIAWVVQFAIVSADAQQGTLFRVLGVRGEVLLERRIVLSGGSLGRVSDTLLKQAQSARLIRQYQGSEGGVTSINDLGSALEVLSDTQMNAYGWCYHVDGRESGLLAHQYALTGTERQIEWFYAYAHLDRNQWKAMCVPADHQPTQE